MKCPICRQPAHADFKPFCSKRSYAIPGEPADVAEDNPPTEEDQ